MQSCSTQDEALRKEEYTKTRDYTNKKIDYLELKKINNQVFIETAKLTKIATASNNAAKGINSNYDLDLQNIQYIKRDNNDETFSFRIFQIPNSTIQQNIVVECKQNKNPQTYLITYYLNKKINQINNSNDFIQAIKSTSIIKINNILTTTKTASSSGCLQIGYYDDVEVCQNNLDSRPRCYESDGTTRAKIKVFIVIDSACSTGGGPTDFIPLASQWQYSHPVTNNPNPENTGVNSGGGYTGNGSPGGDESNSLNIYAANYFTGGDLNDPAVQNMLRINQFITSLYNSSNEIKGIIDNTEWLLAYTNYWIGTNGGLTTSNQNALTYAFNNIPTLFYQHYSNNYTPGQVMNFQISVFQFTLYHGEFLSKLDPLTQKSILDEITSLGQIEFANEVINYCMINSSISDNETTELFFKASRVTNNFKDNLTESFVQDNISYFSQDVQNQILIDPLLAAQIAQEYLIQRAVKKYLHPEWNEVHIYYSVLWDLRHMALDAFGLIPVIGEVADLANGALYTIERDKVNAAFSFASAVPVAGWAAVGVKYAVKIKTVATIGTKVKLTWKVLADGIIYFGSDNTCRAQLRKVLGLAVGNLNQAHHIIPLNKQTKSIVQKASKSGSAFHLNEALIGIPLSTTVHNGSHAHYDDLIQQRFDFFNQVNPNATPNQCYDFLVDLIQDIRTVIQNNPNTPINQLNF